MSDLQILSQRGSTYSRLSRSVPEIDEPVAGTTRNQPTTVTTLVTVLAGGANTRLPVHRVALAEMHQLALYTRARMHHKVVGNFQSEADVRSLYDRR